MYKIKAFMCTSLLIPVLFVRRRELTETFQTQSGLLLQVPEKKTTRKKIEICP